MENLITLHGLHQLMWDTLVVIATLFCFFGLDELIFDIIYWFNFFFKTNRNRPEEFNPNLLIIPEQRIAILTPCWHEHLVIGKMLEHNLAKINYKNYDIFVGVYPNDPETIAAVNEVKKKYDNLHTVICSAPGPTTKSDNLNNIYRYIINHQQSKNITYEIFVLHDSEDVMHPLELKLYNHFFPQYDMVQTPVIPFPVKHRHLIHWIYNDEFAELHVKDMFIRNIICGFIPSAGVGTAFSKKAFNILAKNNPLSKMQGYDSPFGLDHLTEDYDTSLRIHLLKLKMLFLSQTITNYKLEKKWKWFGKTIEKPVKEVIATRSNFPMRYCAALRQRTRWMIGIALQAWEHLGWPGNWRTKYILFHDRKVVFTNIFGGIGYLCFIYWVLVYSYEVFFLKKTSSFQLLLDTHPWAYTLIILSTCLMLIRLIQRICIVKKTYGFIPAIFSILRYVLANLLNAHTSLMAIRTYLVSKYRKQIIKWNKTTNNFPDHI